MKKTTWSTTVAPRVLKIKMKYHATNLYDTTEKEDYVMRGNSVFDPDYTSTGQQPVNYDDIAALYNEYLVIGSKCKATFRNAGINIVRCYMKADFLAGYDAVAYDPYAQKDTIVKVLGPSTGGSDACTIKMYRSTSQLFGRNVKYDPNFSSATTTNPNSQWFWHCGVYDDTAADTQLNVTGDITVTYYVVFRKVYTQMGYD